MDAAAPERWSRQRFATLVSQPGEDIDLAEAALLIACEEYPELEPMGYLGRLDALGATLAARLPAEREAEAAAAVLADFLFREEGFHGNRAAYYDPRNSFLNEVLDRRTGIPITLSAVYMEVARRAGLPVFGVGLPGHFVVRLVGADREVIVDPFHEGALLSEAQCQERLDRIFAGRIRMEPRMLEAVSPRQILERMLRNLKAIYTKEQDLPRSLAVLDLLLVLGPGSLEDLRDRGLVYAAMDCYTFALRDLQAVAARAPARQTPELLSTIETLRHRAARVN